MVHYIMQQTFLGGIDPNQVQQWLQMYISAMERCENNDKQDSYGGAPVTQRTDVQTDLSFYSSNRINWLELK